MNHNQEGSLGNSSCGDIAYSKCCLGVSPVQARISVDALIMLYTKLGETHTAPRLRQECLR